MRHAGESAAGRVNSRVGNHYSGIACPDSRFLQKLARQIQPAYSRVLINVAKNVGQLQCPAELVSELKTRLLLHAEDFDRKPAYRARNALAIEVQGGKIGRADVFD